jgi:hypothetical protein
MDGASLANRLTSDTPWAAVIVEAAHKRPTILLIRRSSFLI